MSDRTRVLMMVFGLAHQLQAWIEFAKSFGYMTKTFKQESTMLSSQCQRMIKAFEADDEDIYEHSVQISDLFERIAKLDGEDVKRVLGLINKIEQTKKTKQCSTH